MAAMAHRAAPDGGRPTEPTLGVEEEYFLVDPVTGVPSPGATGVLRRAAAVLGDRVAGEFTENQIEGRTPPCTGLAEVHAHLSRIRAALAAAAEEEGLRVLASSTPPIGPNGPVTVRDVPRYQARIAVWRSLVEDFGLCGFHTHVQVPEREQAVLVGNHLRPWLPTLVAMTANSPYWHRQDSGYASWRTIVKCGLPGVGPPPFFSCAEQYDQVAAALHETDTVVDTGTLFWDIRPSSHLPTVEVRVMDVTPSPGEAAVLAALVRAMVVTALERVRRGDPGPQLSDPLLRAAYWRSARDGWHGHTLELTEGHLVPTAHLARQLLAQVRPALEESGDLARVTALIGHLAAHGGGAERQRELFARRSSLHDVVTHLADQEAMSEAGAGRPSAGEAESGEAESGGTGSGEPEAA